MKKEIITINDFLKVDLRVGLVKEAARVECSTKLLELTVDFGEDYGVVTILSGIGNKYTPEDLKDKKFLFIANLAPRKMMGKESQGMLVAAVAGEDFYILPLPDEVQPGMEAV